MPLAIDQFLSFLHSVM